MRRSQGLVSIGACVLLFLLGACHAGKDFTQTFVDDSDSGRSLKLTSKAGLIRPAAEFPHNIMFKLFGTDELSGTYELNSSDETANGTFVAGKDGDEQWIRFTSADKKEWKVTVKPGGLLKGDGDTVWEPKAMTVDARAVSEFKIEK